MSKAYVLVKMAAGRGSEVTETLRLLPGVDVVDPVTGPYDLVATVRYSDLTWISDLIGGGMHQVPGVEKTTTCLALTNEPTEPGWTFENGG